MEFKARIWKSGDSNVITIPNDFIKHGLINIDKLVIVSIKEEK